MYKYRKSVMSSDEVEDTRLEDVMSNLKDDFNYMMDTFDRMDRNGLREDAVKMASSIHQTINEVIDSAVQEG